MEKKIIRTIFFSLLLLFAILNIFLLTSNYVKGKYIYRDENGVKHEIILYDNTYDYTIKYDLHIETEQGFFRYDKDPKGEYLHLKNFGTFKKQTNFSITDNNGAYYTSVRAITLQLVYGAIMIISAIMLGLDNYNIKKEKIEDTI